MGIKQFEVNNSWKAHTLLAGVISLWLVLFLVLIAPFDTSDLTPLIRIFLMPVYGMIFFISYLLGYIIQIIWYRHSQSFNLLQEACIIIFIYVCCFLFSWVYYKTEWINGLYDFYTFGVHVFLPIGFVLSVGIIFGRYYLNKKYISKESEKITLYGSNRKDILSITFSQIISVTGAQNYVDIKVVESNSFKTLVLRNTLKGIHKQCPNLIKVHRSYLINPMHFTRWKDNNTAVFNGIEIPIAKTYRKDLNNSIQQNP